MDQSLYRNFKWVYSNISGRLGVHVHISSAVWRATYCQTVVLVKKRQDDSYWMRLQHAWQHTQLRINLCLLQERNIIKEDKSNSEASSIPTSLHKSCRDGGGETHSPIACSGWLCIKSRPIFMGDVIHWLFIHYLSSISVNKTSLLLLHYRLDKYCGTPQLRMCWPQLATTTRSSSGTRAVRSSWQY